MILVIGGTGKIGGEVIRLLAGQGQQCRALVRDPFAASRLAGPGVELCQGDLARPATLPGAFSGITRVFLVTSPGPETVHLQGAAIAAAAAAGVERLVRISVEGVGTPVAAGILEWHSTVERVLADSGIPAVNLRPTSLMQNLLGSVETIRRAGQFFGAQGDGRVAFVDARDVAAAAVGALMREKHHSEDVTLTGPAAHSYADLAGQLSEELGRPVAYVDLPPDAYRAGMIAAGLPEWLARDLALLEDASRGTVMPVADGVERLAGVEPRPFREFAHDYRGVFG